MSLKTTPKTSSFLSGIFLISAVCFCFISNTLIAGSPYGKPNGTKQTVSKPAGDGNSEAVNMEIMTIDSNSLVPVTNSLSKVNLTFNAAVNPDGVDLTWDVGKEMEIKVCEIEKWNGKKWELIGKVQRISESSNTSEFLFHDVTAGTGTNMYRIALAHIGKNIIQSNPVMAIVKEKKSVHEVAIKAIPANNGSQLQISSAYHASENCMAYIFDNDGHFASIVQLSFNEMGLAVMPTENQVKSGYFICLCNPNISQAIQL